ncbi:hypothetical protein N7468_006704 [Penicillium chermesinum]|uniref:Uncharacterized protein n=1 Tax=Penicillium chermesinum TaxID=63820 RepID=A0A9W9NSV5_9EURO|nr:uncharacterized protein N7468_006704 [Penicillium chermesinum]KAJ5225479.1 hypothetical protein N7468_006704 [Penicillium chermesinum]
MHLEKLHTVPRDPLSEQENFTDAATHTSSARIIRHRDTGKRNTALWLVGRRSQTGVPVCWERPVPDISEKPGYLGRFTVETRVEEVGLGRENGYQMQPGG